MFDVRSVPLTERRRTSHTTSWNSGHYRVGRVTDGATCLALLPPRVRLTPGLVRLTRKWVPLRNVCLVTAMLLCKPEPALPSALTAALPR